jgi:hypothetical protein
MNSALSVSLQAFGLFNLADLVAGFIHWFEDAYVDEHTPVLGRTVGRANVIHHHLPRYFTRLTWWQSNWDLHLVSGLLVLAAWRFGFLGWQVWFFALVAANANEVHKWSHRTRAENGPVISFLQDIGLLLTIEQHSRHHTDPKHSHYCPVGNVMNPLLDGLGFWNGLERVLACTVGLHRREDSSVHGHGPAPAWINALRAQRPVPPPSFAGGCRHRPTGGRCPVESRAAEIPAACRGCLALQESVPASHS